MSRGVTLLRPRRQFNVYYKSRAVTSEIADLESGGAQ